MKRRSRTGSPCSSQNSSAAGAASPQVSLDIICEKPNHKAILIGRQGAALKEVLSFARRDMEKFLGCKVFLTGYVKVKEGLAGQREPSAPSTATTRKADFQSVSPAAGCTPRRAF